MTPLPWQAAWEHPGRKQPAPAGVSTATMTAQTNYFGLGRRMLNDERICKIVKEHDVGLNEAIHPADRNEVRIAWTGAYEIDFADCFLCALGHSISVHSIITGR